MKRPQIELIIRMVEEREKRVRAEREQARQEKIARRRMIAVSLAEVLTDTVRPQLAFCSDKLIAGGWQVDIEEILQEDRFAGNGEQHLMAIILKVSGKSGYSGISSGSIEYRGSFDEETIVCSMEDGVSPIPKGRPQPFSQITEESLAAELDVFFSRIFGIEL